MTYATFVITADDTGIRLDRWFHRHYPHVPQSLLNKWIRLRDVRLNGARAAADSRLNPGDQIRIFAALLEGLKQEQPFEIGPSAALVSLVSQVPSWVLYRDASVVVIDKPQGLATQGGTGLRVSLDAALRLWLQEEGVRPYLVHRLDRETSGVVMVALSAATAASLGEAFRSQAVEKTYVALVHGCPAPEAATCTLWVMKRGQKMVVCQDTETSRPPEAREAVTSYRVIETIGVGQDQISRVTLHPRTGRMHQLRVQMATLGCPIVGDRVYGQGDRTPLRLHAERVCVAHPETGKKIEFYSKPLF